ncbi:MAG TPA: nitrite reductase large subunit NirB [Terriglobales bacterium]|nr:nitrite reductase large subunit NirB [Terriglobales bacterium]
MERLVVIGNGMAGVACVEQLLKHGPKFSISILGDETHPNYNRVLLSSVLAGQKDADEITLNPVAWYAGHDIDLRLGARATQLDRAARTVTCEDGRRLEYERLILATGSAPVLPPLTGLNLQGVFVFRTLDDTRALIAAAGAGVRAVVIGGGLLGLEAARGLQLRGCDVTVVHLPDTLMNLQLDAVGGRYLQRHIERLGVRVCVNRCARAVLGDGAVEGVEFADGSTLPANLVVIAAGVRPNVVLAREAGLEVRRGVVVDDQLGTSDPAIYAVGECAEHRGVVHGLVAPLLEQAKVLAAVLAGHRDERYRGSIPAAQLKVMGVEVFSAGEINEGDGLDCVRYEDAGLGVYKKLLLRDGKLAGVALVGDTADSQRYAAWLRGGADLTARRSSLLFPAPAPDGGLDVAQLPAAEVVCGCLGVTKGDLIAAIHAGGINTLAQLKDRTRAATGCGSCAGVCERLLRAVAPDFVEAGPSPICACLPFTQEQLREMIRSQQLTSVQEVLEIYGQGEGCEVCKPALSYLVDLVWCGEHEEDRSARYINDRVHANIQRDGTFSVVPRIRGGVTSPAELRRIADVAEKYRVRMVKITGSQRIDLLGVAKEDLPKIWADLGMPSGQAYTKGVRMVKTCVGTDFCRFGTQDSTRAGIELERRLENLYTPHKVKMAAVGCPRNCAEATVKDIGLIGQEGGWQVVVGGAAGKTVRKADLLVTVATTEEALSAAELFFQYYRENANYLERAYDFIERVGIEKVRKQTVYAPAPARAALLERLRKAKALAKDAWLEREDPVHAAQFVQIQAMEVPQP